MLGASLGGLMRTVAPLLGIYKLIQGVGAVGGNAVDFEKNAQRLKLSRYSGDEQAEIRRKSLSLASSGQYTMNAAQNIDYAIRGAAISPDTRGVIDSMELMNRIDLGMRKLNVEDSKEGATGMLMNQIWEKMGDRTIKQKSETANLLAQYEGYYGGQVPLSQFSRQLQQSRGAKLGANKFSLFGELFHGISEQLTAGGGGGGMGGVGSSALALDRIFSQGIMSKQMIGIWKEAGMFPGIEEFAQHHKGRGGRSVYVDMPSGKHVLHNGGTLTGAGSDTYNKDVYHNYLAQKPPPWYEQAASDRIGFLQGPVKAGMERYFHLQPGGFEKQKDVEQKRMVGTFFYGATQKAIGEVIEIMTGRYEKTVKQQQLGVKGAKNLDQVLATSTSVEDRWAKMMAAFESFGNALGNNENVVKALNNGIDALSAVIKLLNDNVGPIANWLTGNADPEKKFGALMTGRGPSGALSSGFSNLSNAVWHGGSSGPNMGRQLWKGMQGSAGAIIAAARHYGVDPVLAMATAMHESGGNPFAVGDHGTSFGLFQLHQGGELGNMSKTQAFNPVTNAMRALSEFGRHPGLSGGSLAAASQRPANPTAYANAVNSLMPAAKNIVIHNDIHLDGKKIGEHVSHHVERKQLKSAQKMNHAASNPGGSYSPKIYSHGVSH